MKRMHLGLTVIAVTTMMLVGCAAPQQPTIVYRDVPPRTYTGSEAQDPGPRPGQMICTTHVSGTISAAEIEQRNRECYEAARGTGLPPYIVVVQE